MSAGPWSVDGADDRGLTLVEILITVALMGIAIVSIIASWQGAISLSDRNELRSDMQIVLQSAGESVASRDIPLVPCAVPVDYQLAAERADPNRQFQISVEKVEYYDYSDTVRPYTTSCPVAANLQRGPQLVTVRITNPDDGRTKTVEVVKE